MTAIFAIITVLSIQFIGLFVTAFIRPFYIARYSVVVLGFALLIAFGTENLKVNFPKNNLRIVIHNDYKK